MEEQWKDVPYTDGRYSVSNLGRVRSNFKSGWGNQRIGVVKQAKILPVDKYGYVSLGKGQRVKLETIMDKVWGGDNGMV